MQNIFFKPKGQTTLILSGLSLTAMLLYLKKKHQDADADSESSDENPSELSHLDDHLNGLEKVFSVEARRTRLTLPVDGVLKKYSFAVGLPNSANTCYMNSLLQALSGCTLFTNYMERLWKHIQIDDQSDDEIAVYYFVRSVRELSDGSMSSHEWTEQLHDLLCSADTSSSSGVPFTHLFEQQDSHDLMFYLLEKVTKITAKFARHQSRGLSLACSVDLLEEAKAERGHLS